MGTVKRNVNKKVVESLKEQETTCGECAGLCTEIIKDKKLCKDAGVLETSKPCNKFTPNTSELKDTIEDGAFLEIAHLVSEVDTSKLRTLGALIMKEKQTRDAGYNMGEKVYVRYRGEAKRNYLSNFMSAYIVYADSRMTRVCSRDGKISMTYTGKARSAVIRSEKFKKMKDRMLRNENYTDPQVQKQISKSLESDEEYNLSLSGQIDDREIPTIDKVFKANKVGKRETNSTNKDLVSIVEQIEKGHSIKDESKTPNDAKRKKVSSSRKSKGKGRPQQIDVT